VVAPVVLNHWWLFDQAWGAVWEHDFAQIKVVLLLLGSFDARQQIL
jgi:hypothetical protein